MIKGIHNLKNKPAGQISKRSLSGVWNNIARVPIELQKMGISIDDVFVKKVCAGDETLFWQDLWCGAETFKTTYLGYMIWIVTRSARWQIG